VSRAAFILLLSLCAVAFAAAVWGSVDCGLRLSSPVLAEGEAFRLRGLIYFHFALAQVSVLGAGLLLYCRHRRWRKYYLMVAYNERGMSLNPPGIRMPSGRVYRCCLGHMEEAVLPPADAPILLYPMFMLSGHSSGAKLTAALEAAYAHASVKPKIFLQPVLGASPWLAQVAAEQIRRQLSPGTGVLVVAHGSRLAEPPPEPALFCRRLRELLPNTEVALGYFQQQPPAPEVLREMKSRHVLLLPFLLTEGVHTSRDLPTPEQAAACGKTLTRLPVAAELLQHCNRP